VVVRDTGGDVNSDVSVQLDPRLFRFSSVEEAGVSLLAIQSSRSSKWWIEDKGG
jgi:hypothetical protein